MSASTSQSQSNDWQSSSSSSSPSPHPVALLLDDVFSKAQLEIDLNSDSGQTSEAHVGNQGTSGSGSDNQRQRQVAFYDETLRPRIQLYLPPSTALPSPDPSSSASSLTFPLPLPQENELEEVDHGSDTSLNKPPKLVSILLSSLQINLEASYISPQPISLPPSHSSSFQTTTSTNSHPNFTPLPTVPAGEVGYQLQPSSSQAFQNSNPPLNLTPLAMQNYQNSAPATFHSSSWFGNKIPTNTSEEKESNDLISKSNVSWIAGKDGSKGRWKVVWETETPIVYVRSRHNSPLVALTATLSLRISSHLLSIILPLSKSNTELSTPFPPHDLLTNLSSGPIYPDESPLERASRMNKNSSSLSNLPLDRLGQEILGSNLVTLQQGRTALSKMTRKESSIPLPHEDEAESDLADIGSSSYSSSERRDLERRRNVGGVDEFDLSDVGSRSGTSPSKPSQEKKPVIKDHSIGSEVRVIRRSCRRTLDVRSAIAVRMRTLLAPPLVQTQRSKSSGDVKDKDDEMEKASNDDSGYDSNSDSDLEAEFELLATRDSSLERALVLCVELENPPDSGVKFEIQSCSIKMEGSEDRRNETDKGLSSSQSQAKLNATLFEDENVNFPMVLDQGQQVNALYYVELNLGEEEILSLLKDDGRANQRHVTIVVDGRPLLLKNEASVKESETQGYHLDGNDDQAKVEATSSSKPSSTTSESLDYSIPNFLSTWNCQIDTTVLQNALNRRRAASLVNSSVTTPFNSHRQTSSSIAVSSSVVAGDANFAASTLAQSAAEEAARFQPSSSNPQVNTLQGRKSVSPIPPRSPLNSGPPAISTSGPAAVLSQRRDTLTVDSPIGISPNRGRLASLTGVGGVPFSPASMTPRSTSFGLGPPPMTGGSTGFTSHSSGSFGGARTPSGGVGLGLLASAKNRASSLQATSNDTSMSGLASSFALQSPAATAQQRPLLPSVQAPRTPLPMTPGNDNEINWWPSNSGISSRKDVLPWTSSSGPSAASLLRGIDAQSPILVSTKIETNRRSRSSASGASVPSVDVLESFSLVVLIFNREVENRSFMISWPQVELDSDGEVVSQKDGQAALVKGPRGSLVSSSLFIKSRLLDAEGARRAHATVQSSQQRSALLPEENHLMIGPILPGTSESVHLPIKALIPGIHPIAPNGLVISDVETAEERRLFDVGNIVVKENDVQLEI